MPEPVPDATAALSEADRLMQGGSFESVVGILDILANVVEHEDSLSSDV